MMAFIFSETIRIQDKLSHNYGKLFKQRYQVMSDHFFLESSVFHSSEIPNILLDDYFTRLFINFRCSSTSFMIIYIYINRILEKNEFLLLCSLTIHR